MMRLLSDSDSPRSELKLSLILAFVSALILAPFTLYLRQCDEGFFIHDALRMADGERLYRDIAEHLDPLPFWTLKAVFLVFGRSFLAMRAAFIAMIAVTASLLYLIGRYSGLSRSVAILAALLFVLSVPPFFSYSHHWQSTCLVIVGIALFLAAQQRGSGTLFFFSGLFYGSMFHAHLTKGFVMTGIGALWLVLTIVSPGAKSRSRCLLLSGWWLLGTILAMAIVPLWFYCSGLWPDYRQGVFIRKVRYASFFAGKLSYGRTAVSEFTLAELAKHPREAAVCIQQSVMFVLPIIVVVGALLQFAHPQCRRERLLNSGNFLILCALGLWSSILYYPQAYVVFTVMGLVFPSLALLAQRSTSGKISGQRRALMLLGGLFLLYGVKTVGTVAGNLYRDDSVIQTELGPVIISERLYARDALQLTRYFRKRGAGNCAFVYPYAPNLYFLCGLNNPTRFSNAHQAYTSSQDEEEVQRKLKQNPDCMIIFLTKHRGCSHEMASWIRQNYQKEKSFWEFEVWASSDNQNIPEIL